MTNKTWTSTDDASLSGVSVKCWGEGEEEEEERQNEEGQGEPYASPWVDFDNEPGVEPGVDCPGCRSGPLASPPYHAICGGEELEGSRGAPKEDGGSSGDEPDDGDLMRI